ncbi:MAG TPA: sensor domain-containing protein, partial [Steroidobacteraceae bacterium]|nr:sensor domain-containing protein [Steroidobacteraceae bacterium]
VPTASVSSSGWKRFFGVYLDPRAYTSLFYMLLTLATGILYFTIVVTGLSLSAGFAILIIGIPFFLAFIGITRVIALGEGRLIEAVTGERMPRRPVHPGPAAPWLSRIGEMLKDVRTWTTLLYLLLMLPLGIVYFTVTVTALSVGLAFTLLPLVVVAKWLGWASDATLFAGDVHIGGWMLSDHSTVSALILGILGVLIVTLFLHAARAVGRGHAHLAKALLVVPGG